MALEIEIDKRQVVVARELNVLGRPAHQADSGFEVNFGLIMNFPQLPRWPETIMGMAEQLGQRQPEYTPGQVAKIFLFSRSQANRQRAVLDLLERYPCEPGDPHWFKPVPEDLSGFRWTLGDVERMIRFLSRAQAIEADRTIIALMVVLWTAKGYGLYA